MFYTAHLTKGAALDVTNLLNQSKLHMESTSRETKKKCQSAQSTATHLVASGVRINHNLIRVFLKTPNHKWEAHVKSKSQMQNHALQDT